MAQFARGPQTRATSQSLSAPHAALLIDFDNVTMGIRSDLTKELRSLLNSDVIKGKVAVQRAYADWRRYPQYIVPLAENSVDLIFAPAYGSSKKNATDIRLAIDALELVFTRPEIGTFILLSGDSDFSSLVLKLKEYGKYVIGVGIRESSSDLLVQNCDEYYSYSGLTGLTRAGEEPVHAASDDPWELVAIAVRQMHEQRDVMRSDRLKQILLHLDPNFDEKALGFPKFNRFLQEAANRGSLSLRKMENGQFEVAPVDAEPVVTGAALPPVTVAEPHPGRRGRGRGRDRDRDRDRDREVTAATPVAAEVVPEAEAAVPTLPVAAPSVLPEELIAPVTPTTPEAEVTPVAPTPAREAAVAPVGEGARAEAPVQVTELRSAYDLLRRVTSDMAKSRGTATRDSDVKRRMLEASPGFDEGRYGFSKFSRFLRQAHDEGVVDLHRLENGTYEVSPAGRELPSAASAPAPEEGRGRERGGRGRGREPRERGAEPRVAAAMAEAAPARAQAEPSEPKAGREAPIEKAVAAPATTAGRREEPAATPTAEKPAAAATRPAPAVPAAAPAPAAVEAGRPSVALGMRRGSRRGGAPAAPPPILAGQAVPFARTAGEPAKPAAQPVAPAAQPAAAAAKPVAPAAKPAAPAAEAREPAKQAAREAPVAAAAQGDGRKRGTRGRGKAEPVKPKAATVSPLDRMGLPTKSAAVIEHLDAYNGVGRKSAEAAVSAFGADIFRVMQEQPEKVREELGARLADPLLKGWEAEISAQGTAGAKPARGAGAKGASGEQIEVFEAQARRSAAKRTTAGAKRAPAAKKTSTRKTTSTRKKTGKTTKAGSKA